MAARLPSLPIDFEIFHPFSRLPQELRIRIWRLHLAALQPRTLTLCPKRMGDVRSSFPTRSTNKIQHLFSSDPSPPTLYACHESRLEALAFYIKAFGSMATPNFIWTNFDLDTIKINDQHLSKIPFIDKERIQQMIVEVDNVETFWGQRLHHFDRMKMLRKLELVSAEILYEWSGVLHMILDSFWEHFGDLPGYVCPEVKIVQKGTPWEMNIRNYEAIMSGHPKRQG